MYLQSEDGLEDIITRNVMDRLTHIWTDDESTLVRNYSVHVTKFGSRSGPIFCLAGFGYKLFGKVQPAEERRCHLEEKILI